MATLAVDASGMLLSPSRTSPPPAAPGWPQAAAGTFFPGPFRITSSIVGPDGKIQVVEDLRYQSHRSADRHPERPERLVAVGQALAHFEHAIERMSPRPAEPDEILRIHSPDQLARIEEAARLAPGRLDPDTYVCRESFDVARLAAGGTVDLARSIARGGARCGFAAVRPPGHHAETDRAMGFCLFNNVAIAARALQADGVGQADDSRLGRPSRQRDATLLRGRIPSAALRLDPPISRTTPAPATLGEIGLASRSGCHGQRSNAGRLRGPDEYDGCDAADRGSRSLDSSEPEMILVSCGFDAHRDDPLAAMEVSEAGLPGADRRSSAGLADELCESRLMFVLEGGYAVSGLVEGTRALLAGITLSRWWKTW